MSPFVSALRRDWFGIVGTSLVFASAAALAVQFVEPEYRARTSIALAAGIGAPELIARAGFAEGGDVASRSFLRSILSVVERGVASPGRPPTLRVTPTVAGIDILATAATSDEARRTAVAAGERILAAVPASRRPESGSGTTGDTEAAEALRASIEGARSSLSRAERELETVRLQDANEPGSREQAAATQRLAALRDERRALADRAATLQGVEATPSADGNALDLPEPFSALLAERERLASSVEDLAASLGVDNPRLEIVRQRLAQVEDAVASQAAAAFEQARARERELDRAIEIEERELLLLGEAQADRAAIAGRLDVLRSTVQAADRALAALLAQDAAIRLRSVSAGAGEPDDASLPAARLEAPDIEQFRVEPLPAALVGALIGLVLAFLLALARERLAAASLAKPPAFGPIGPAAGDPAQRRQTHIGRETVSRDELVDGLVASGVTRIVVSGPAKGGGRVASVDIARRLTLRSEAVLLVDLSADGRALRAMGAGDRGASRTRRRIFDGAGTIRDFATSAEILDARRFERTLDEEVAGLEARYDFVVLEMGAGDAQSVAPALGPRAAFLVSVDEFEGHELGRRLEAIREAGLDEPLLLTASVNAA